MPEARFGLGKALKAVLAGALTLLEDGIYKLQGPKDKDKWLWGNFAPIPYPGDLFVSDLKIEGQLPPEVTGLFARNGPNPVYINSGYHWFDGDGYVHAIKLDAATQSANYSGQFMRTSKLKQETAAGRALFDKFGDSKGPLYLGLLMVQGVRKMLGLVDFSKGRYVANTALMWHAGQLWALHEGEQPHLLTVEPNGAITMVGQVHKAGASPSSFFTAHPKIDPATKRLYAFGYDLEKAPYLTYYQLDEQGDVVRLVPLNFSKPCMTHDFAITPNYAIFFEGSMYIDPPGLLKGQALFHFDPNKPMRFAVLPLNATSADQAQWFDAKPGYVFHLANAWEEDGGKTIRMPACRFERFDLDFRYTVERNVSALHMTPLQLDDRYTRLHEYVLHLDSGRAEERRLVGREVEPRALDFPQIDPARVGRYTRYFYMVIYDDKGEVAGLAKADMEGPGGKTGLKVLNFGEGITGGEAMFVPRQQAETEDDGYLLTFTYSYGTNSSDFRVYDARTFDPTPVARVPLPRRVPHGFHALWVPQEELSNQVCHTPAKGE